MSEYCPSCMAENTDGAEKCSVCGGDMRAQNRQHQLDDDIGGTLSHRQGAG